MVFSTWTGRQSVVGEAAWDESVALKNWLVANIHAAVDFTRIGKCMHFVSLLAGFNTMETQNAALIRKGCLLPFMENLLSLSPS